MKIYNEVNLSTNQVYKLNDIYNSLSNYIKKMDLNNFKGIKIVDDSSLNLMSDGHFENGLILLPKDKTQKYLNLGNCDILKSTIFHELCHLDLYNKMPILHKLHEDYCKKDDFIKAFTIMIYIEYLAQLMSSDIETIATQEHFFSSVYNLKYDFSNVEHKIYFIKSCPYIIGRDKNNEYIIKIKNKEFKRRLEEVRNELLKLPVEKLIDNYKILYNLEKIVSKYISNDI